MKERLESRVNPGDLVPGGFSYPNNATVSGDTLYLRDANGNQISGRSVSNGDRITVLKIVSEKNWHLFSTQQVVL